MFDQRRSRDDFGEVFGIVVLALVAVTPILYVPPLIACLAQSQRFPPYAASVLGTLQLPAHMSDPLRAYPRAVDALMPDARHWWLIVGVGLGLVARSAARWSESPSWSTVPVVGAISTSPGGIFAGW